MNNGCFYVFMGLSSNASVDKVAGPVSAFTLAAPPGGKITGKDVKMAENETVTTTEEESTQKNNSILTTDLYGRRTIFSSVEELTEENVISEVNSALAIHIQNMREEERLYWYRRGVQPVLARTKTNNDFVCNRIVENHAEEIVSFKNGYFMTQPAYYVSRNDTSQDKVDKLNEYLYRSGKLDCDNETVDWFHTVGLGYIYVEPNDDPEIPFKAVALRPMSAFVAYSMGVHGEPVYAGYTVVNDHRIYIDVYTKDRVFRLNGTYDAVLANDHPDRAATAVQLLETRTNVLGEIPIIEYRYNSTNMASFEPVIGILDAINSTDSDRSDGITQFIESLLVITNADLDENESASTIREKGMILIKSTSELAAKVEMITQQLDQSQTQVYVDHLIDNMLIICGMPTRAEGGSVVNATGDSVRSAFGWYQADAFARNTADLFKKSNRQFDRIVLKILKDKNLLDIDINDFELQFVRNEQINIQSKAQAYQTLLAAGMHPELAAAKSGISNDPVADTKMSDKYLKMIWGDPDKPEEITAPDVNIPETGDNPADENQTGGEV